MPQVCLYLQLHQPFRLSNFSVLDIGQQNSYFLTDTLDENKAVFQKVAQKSYTPMLRLLLKLVQTQARFKVAFSCSGVFLEQAQLYEPEIIGLLQQLAQSDQVEFLAETYYHSLASLYSVSEFNAQIAKHTQLIFELFQVKPTTFRNTELIYVNSLAAMVESLGFQGVLTEAVPRYLHGRSLTQVFKSTTTPAIPLLLKHAQLSDDIAFRFSNRDWQWYPLTVDRYLDWLQVYGEDELINLFMDFETFGEHQWVETGIFSFFEELIHRFSTKSWNSFVLPREKLTEINEQGLSHLPVYDVPKPISWADVDRDLTAWTENELQKDTLSKLYALETAVLATDDPVLIDDWRKLQTSDHFYYMCIKWSADGDVHAYFSPYESPYEAYRRYSIVLADLQERLL